MQLYEFYNQDITRSRSLARKFTDLGVIFHYFLLFWWQMTPLMFFFDINLEMNIEKIGNKT